MSTNPLVKLNLGCGDKILGGYANVDVAESRAGRRLNILCDLRALTPFEDNSADEILSVHVVEHFWRWEVVGVLMGARSETWRAHGPEVPKPVVRVRKLSGESRFPYWARSGRSEHDVGVLRRSLMARSAHGSPLWVNTAKSRRHYGESRARESSPGASAVQVVRAARYAPSRREAAKNVSSSKSI